MLESRGRRRIAGVLAVVVGVSSWSASSALAGSRAINFDDVTAPCNFGNTTALTNRYTASLGVTFSGPAPGQGGAILNECGGFGVTGHSAPNFLAFNTTAGYPQPPETITFAEPIHTFEIKAGQDGTGGTFTVTGFDGTTPVSENSRSSSKAVAVLGLSATRMTSVRLTYTPGTVQYMIFDDVKFGTAPSAGDDSYEVTQNGTLNVSATGVLGNDKDSDGDAITSALSRGAGNGTVTLRPDGSFSYTPNSGFFGNDSFGYRANDGTGNGNEATVTVKVNQLPTPPPPPPPVVLKVPAVLMSYKLLGDPKRVTRFQRLLLNNVARGSRVSVKCLTKKRKACKGKLKTSFTKRNAKGTLRMKVFEKKRYPAGSRIDATITKSGSKTQYKTLVIRKNADPSIVTRCSTPPSKTRRSC